MRRKCFVKRRSSGQVATAVAFEMLWRSGYDFFHELDDFGIVDDDEKYKKAEITWRQFGAKFLAKWDPIAECAKAPWALEQFGNPPGWRQ